MEVKLVNSNYSFIVINGDQSADYYDSVWNRTGTYSYDYYIRKKSDPLFTSNIASILVCYSINPQFFYAKDDSLSVSAYGVVVHDLVADDHNVNQTDSLKIIHGTNGLLSDSVRYTNRVITYYPDNTFEIP